MVARRKKLHEQVRLGISQKKRLSIIECTATLSKVKKKAYSSDSIDAMFVNCRSINKIDATHNTRAIMKVSNTMLKQS